MLNFRTSLQDTPFPIRISHNTPVIAIGSCFVENIGFYLEKYKFNISINPHGVLYNPISIGNSLQSILDNEQISKKHLFQVNDLWCSLNHHSQFSNSDFQAVLEAINTSTEQAHQQLMEAKVLILTLGSGFAYEFLQQQSIVANCHKIPQKHFKKRLLSVQSIVQQLSKHIENLQKKLPNLQIILSLSPVRHIKDGIIENQRSKATLLLAIHHLIDQFKNVYYFPSYEIILDDLRDYRFYQEDLVHPNGTAIKYVWEYFKRSFFAEKTQELLLEIEKVLLAVGHKPFNPESKKHQQFITSQLNRISQLQSKYPQLDFNQELEHLTTALL